MHKTFALAAVTALLAAAPSFAQNSGPSGNDTPIDANGDNVSQHPNMTGTSAPTSTSGSEAAYPSRRLDVVRDDDGYVSSDRYARDDRHGGPPAQRLLRHNAAGGMPAGELSTPWQDTGGTAGNPYRQQLQ
jgi:hypothetical protein